MVVFLPAPLVSTLFEAAHIHGRLRLHSLANETV